MGRSPCRIVLVVLALAVPSGAVRSAEVDRLGRTRGAVEDLESVLARAEAKGLPTLFERAPALVGRAVLAQIDRPAPAEQGRILDHVYERCLHAKLALLRALEGKRRATEVPPPPALGEVKLRGANACQGERVVFPVACAEPLADALRPFFSQGDFVRATPALAGATPENVEQTEVFRVYREAAAARRVGWERPAGGFVRDALLDTPAILTCIDHPTMRGAILAEMAKATEPWLKTARPLYHSLGGECFYVDFSELSANRFAAWLRDRYKTLREINTVWDTKHKAFAPELMPKADVAPANPAQWYDWVAFNQWRFTEHARWACENVRRVAPDLPVGLAPLRYAFAGSLGLSGVNPGALGELLDVVEITGGDAMQADLAAALAEGKRAVVDAAMGAGPFGVLPHFVHGCSVLRLAAWPPAPLETLGAVLDAERALREALEARRLGPALAALARVPKPVALLYSAASLRQVPSWALRCAETPYTRELSAAWEAARPLGLACGFVTSRDVASRALRGASVIVVAGAPYEDERTVTGLIEHVEDGGHVVLISESLVGDERSREAEHLLRLGIEVLETQRPTYASKERPDRGGALDDVLASDVPEALLSPTPKGPLGGLKTPLVGRGIRQKAKINVLHDVWATFPDQSPAIVSYARGRGRVTYLAIPLAPADLSAVLQAVLYRAGIEPLVRLMAVDGRPASGLECRAARQEGGVVVSVWNRTGDARRVALHASSARSASSPGTGDAVPVQPAPDGVVVGPFAVAPFETALVQLTLGTAPRR